MPSDLKDVGSHGNDPKAVMYRTAPNMAARVLATVVPLLFCCLGATAGQDDGPVVATVTGQVRGTTTHTTDLPDKPIYTFLGIPYAAPPVGDLRYRPPQPAVPWEGVRDAVEYGSYCPQNLTSFNAMDHDFPEEFGENMTTSEDCLTVNVYTPTVAPDTPLPVLLWIHGGALMIGFGSPPGWEAIAAHQDVVVVSINYRLGVLGFLSTGDDNMPGNYGFLDQVHAMKWVKENIRNFGGDPDRVTIFGESAGGISVSYHLLSPLSKGLFQRAISQSGTWKTFPVNPEPLTVTKMFAEKAGCETEDTAVITACLKEKTPEELLEAFAALGFIPFLVPVVDGTFLTTDPMELMDKGEINTVDYLLGFNNHEMGWLALSESGMEGDPRDGMSQEEFVKLLRAALSMFYQGNPNVEKMLDAVVAEYRPTTPDDPLAILLQFTHVNGDSTFIGPTMLAAEKHADAGARIFLYENEYRPSIHPNRPDWVGSDHADDLFMIWGFPFMEIKEQKYTKDDEKFSLTMMAYWANFARTGDPSDSTGGPPDSPSLPTWPQYTPDNPVYMKLDVEPTTGVGLKAEKLKFWNEVLPKLAAAKKDEL
ncbi:Cocaine esterase [Branchiostoma belcheri]|nr:Cocaine esterase [Branchiostoma belcheri]